MPLIIPRRHRPSFASGFARSAAQAKNPGLWKGLVGLWDASLGATGNTLHDVSGRHHPGTLVNSPTWVSSPDGGALDFDGISDEVEIGSGLNDIPLGDFTLQIHASPWTPTSDRAACAWSGTDDLVIYLNDTGQGTGGLRVFWRNRGGSIINLGEASQFNIWQLVTIVREGERLRAYRDATEIADVALTNPGTEGPFDEFNIGSFNTGVQHAKMSLASLDIYNRALNPSEILDLSQDRHALTRLRDSVLPFTSGAAPATGNPWYYYAQHA